MCENVDEEPPQKCKKTSVGADGEIDFVGDVRATFIVNSGLSVIICVSEVVIVE